MPRPSYEILGELVKRVTAREFAYRMRVHVSIAYKWSNKPDPEQVDADTARNNPVDRVEDILRMAVTNGHHDLAVEVMDRFAREFGGAYVSDHTVAAIKRVAELARPYVSEKDIAQLKEVTEKDKSGIVGTCMFCGFKYVSRDPLRPLSHACDACYDKATAELGKDYELIKRQ
ncbi:MAG TPA: hypothetical protein VGH22_15475 [Candidatus Binatia bacterium]|jgi:hypothetical protein